ncbi:MAG: energy transducer TonB [Nibricoccus sp.]
MKTLHGFALLLAGLLVSPALSPAVFAAEASDKRLAVIQTTEPFVRTRIAQVLPAHAQVRLLINVDATGKLVDWLLLDYSESIFADAVVDAVKQWRFDPATYKGTPIGTRTTLVFNFETNGQVVSMTCLDMIDAYMKNFTKDQMVKCVVPGKELDSAPKPLVMVSPLAIPAELAAGASGVTVDFYIDETGRPRMPAVDVKENDPMALASLAAIEHWRFTPPTSKGRPVTVRATQWFDFSKTTVAAK